MKLDDVSIIANPLRYAMKEKIALKEKKQKIRI